MRNKLKTKATNDNLSNNKDEPFNHDKFLERNFWGYVKKVTNYDEFILPTFNMDDGLKHFISFRKDQSKQNISDTKLDSSAT